MFKMRWTLLLFLPLANGCWIYSKEKMVNKIDKLLDGKDVDRNYVHDLEKMLPKAVSWAIEKIGVDNAFIDCDANKDGKITIKEMRETVTCMSSCTKLAVLNMVL